MKKKTKLIQQIRAMECVPVVRTDFVDFTETSGQGFLSEMSIAEVLYITLTFCVQLFFYFFLAS